jgi:hypothetical protein
MTIFVGQTGLVTGDADRHGKFLECRKPGLTAGQDDEAIAVGAAMNTSMKK